MKRALIATLYNEADNVERWWEALKRQTVQPDEIVVVDGGSRDGTWEKLQELARTSVVPVRLEQKRCNIAAGRNLAIRLTDAEIIAATDAGSFAEPEWFDEITKPLLEDCNLDVVGGHSVHSGENGFQKFLLQLDAEPPAPVVADELSPSSRNTAYRRQAWIDVGGYPEWLTLTAEDSLFNFQLHRIGKRFIYNPRAVVTWPVRGTAQAYYKMLYNYGYGAAEARQDSSYFWRRTAIMVCPFLILFSRRWGCRHFLFRYRKNLSSARGWIVGWFAGHRLPVAWRRIRGGVLSPEAQACLRKPVA